MRLRWQWQESSPDDPPVAERTLVLSLRWKTVSLLQVTMGRRPAWFTATTPAIVGSQTPDPLSTTWNQCTTTIAQLVKDAAQQFTQKPTLWLSLRVMALEFKGEYYTRLWYPALRVPSSLLMEELHESLRTSPIVIGQDWISSFKPDYKSIDED